LNLNWQNIGLIRDEVHEDNFYSLYAQAYALGCEHLMSDLRDLCVTSLLNKDTVLRHYNDVIEHNETQIMGACVSIILSNFAEICDIGDEALKQLMELSYENFIQMLEDDNLNLREEETLVSVVREYISVRDKAGPKTGSPPQELVKPELWAMLTD